MKTTMYKSNREKKDISFWGRKDIFTNYVQFDNNKAKEYIQTLKLTDDDKCLFVESFIQFYLEHKMNAENYYWFNKSIEFINEVSGITINTIYKLTLEHIGQFERKEDFEIFYYFKSLEILQDGYNNIFSELLNWLSYNDKTINNLLEKNLTNEKEIEWHHILLIGSTKSGKSLYLKKQLLKENCVVMSEKDMKLTSFHEEDKEYFYQLLINLTIDNNIHSVLKKVADNKNNIAFKGVASYIEKRLNFECLQQKMLSREIKIQPPKQKIIKI